MNYYQGEIRCGKKKFSTIFPKLLKSVGCVNAWSWGYFLYDSLLITGIKARQDGWLFKRWTITVTFCHKIVGYTRSIWSEKTGVMDVQLYEKIDFTSIFGNNIKLTKMPITEPNTSTTSTTTTTTTSTSTTSTTEA